MTAMNITVIGNLTGDPELRFTANGAPVTTFTVASNERYKDQAGEWQDGQTSFVRCNAWRDLAEHVAESVSKGDRVIVNGTLRQRDYETKEGEKRTVWEVAASEVGAALRYATVKVSKVRRDSIPPAENPWSREAPVPSAPAEDAPPF
jgi:single-strand DNA-binding protein